MKIILDIQAPKGNKHIVWEHLMKSIFAFAGMFALLFFGPMFLEGRARRVYRDREGGIAYDFLIYMLTHPEIQFIICGLAVLLYNLYFVLKNTRKKYVVRINLDGEDIKMGRTNLYFKGMDIITIPVSDLFYSIENKNSEFNEKKQTLKFIDKTNGKLIGLIKPKHFLWNESMLKLKNAIDELNKLGVEKR